MHSRTTSARIAHHNTLTVLCTLCTRFLLKTLTYLKSRNRTPESIPYIITLRKYTLSYHIGGECTLSYYFAEVYHVLLLCWATPNIITLLRYTLPHYIAGLHPILTKCSGESNLITLLSNSNFMHGWAIPNLNTLWTYTLSYYSAELFLML